MFRKFAIISLSIVLLHGLSGCVINVNDDDWEREDNWRAKQKQNERAISRLSLGESRQAIEQLLGEPDLVDAFDREGDEIKILFYRTQHERSDGKTTRDETTPLVFRNDVLTGWGASAVDYVTDD